MKELKKQQNTLRDNKSNRNIKIILNSINELKLDLSGLTVLTECGTNSYMFSPVIACLANAKVVKVIVIDTPEYSAESIITEFKELIADLSFNSKIEFFLNPREYTFFHDVDIITNSGMIRPLNKEKLSLCQKNVVIPLMYEKWEFRNSDIDINYCLKKGIKVGGVWENHPRLKIFEFCENLLIKLIFDSGLEIRENRFLIFSTDEFGKMAARGIKKLGGFITYIGVDSKEIYKNVPIVDAIIFCDYLNTDDIIGSENSYLSDDRIKMLNSSISLIHLSGMIHTGQIREKAINIYPDEIGRAIRMTKTLDYLGPITTIKLLTAGMKVGEEMRRGNYSDLTQLF